MKCPSVLILFDTVFITLRRCWVAEIWLGDYCAEYQNKCFRPWLSLTETSSLSFSPSSPKPRMLLQRLFRDPSNMALRRPRTREPR